MRILKNAPFYHIIWVVLPKIDIAIYLAAGRYYTIANCMEIFSWQNLYQIIDKYQSYNNVDMYTIPWVHRAKQVPVENIKDYYLKNKIDF